VKWRRNHIAELIGNTMFIHGGIDDFGNVISESWLLDLNCLRWHRVDIKGPKMALAHHSSASAFFSDKRNHNSFTFFKSNDVNSLAKNRKFKNEGIYIFGGIDNDNKIRNELKLLKIGKKVPELIFPRTEGQPPIGRLNCSLNYCEELNVLILHGGKIESQEYLNDLFMLDLETLNWIKIIIYDSEPVLRADHTAIVLNSKLLIFGGTNANNFIGSDIYFVNLSISSLNYFRYFR